MKSGTCIWCLREAADVDVEHVFPDCLGCPPDLVLPGTVVCRSCNSGMAVLDQAVADEFDLLALMGGVPRKGGRAPEVGNRGNVHGRVTAAGPELFFNLETHPVLSLSGRRLAPARGRPRDIRPTITQDGVLTKIEFDVAFGQSKNFVPGIFKIALNSTAFLLGADVAAQPEFQGVRDFVRKRIGARHLILSAADDNKFSLAAFPPWKASDGSYAIELRIATIRFLVDLSNDESHFPLFLAKATEMYGEEGWTTLPAQI